MGRFVAQCYQISTPGSGIELMFGFSEISDCTNMTPLTLSESHLDLGVFLASLVAAISQPKNGANVHSST